MNILTLKIIHLASIISLVMVLGAWISSKTSQKLYSITHGVTILLILGTGLLMAFQYYPQKLPGWIHAKLTFWLILAFLPFALKKLQNANRTVMWWGVQALVLGAIVFAVLKP